jgi:[ribosomal protein S5]-alanine N-acetyltransferase
MPLSHRSVDTGSLSTTSSQDPISHTMSTFPETLNTPRLSLHRATSTHEGPLFDMHSDEQVMAWLGGIKSREENRKWLEIKIQHWEDHGFGLFAFYDHENRFVGRGGLLSVDIDDEARVELNYSIAADHWGMGYATEAGACLISAGFETLSLHEVVAFTLPSNKASQRVMKKVGMTYERDFTHHQETAVLYRIRNDHRLTNA